MTLRAQIKEIALSRLDPVLVEEYGERIGLLLNSLAHKAFVDAWTGFEVRVIRHACRLLEARGFVGIDEPAYADPIEDEPSFVYT